LKAVIIGGGYGTRMHPLTLRTPKLLLPIAGKPNITWLIKALKEAGIENVYLSINTNQLKVKKFLGNNEYVKIILEESTDHSNKLGSSQNSMMQTRALPQSRYLSFQTSS